MGKKEKTQNASSKNDGKGLARQNLIDSLNFQAEKHKPTASTEETPKKSKFQQRIQNLRGNITKKTKKISKFVNHSVEEVKKGAKELKKKVEENFNGKNSH